MCKIEPLLFFYKDGFSIKSPTKVDMPLKQRNQTKPNQTKPNQSKVMSIQLTDNMSKSFFWASPRK